MRPVSAEALGRAIRLAREREAAIDAELLEILEGGRPCLCGPGVRCPRHYAEGLEW